MTDKPKYLNGVIEMLVKVRREYPELSPVNWIKIAADQFCIAKYKLALTHIRFLCSCNVVDVAEIERTVSEALDA